MMNSGLMRVSVPENKNMIPKRQVIYLHPEVPQKPALGETCNGCGVCCAIETCPVSRVWLMQWRGPCRALQWQQQSRRYVCGMVDSPKTYLRLLPSSWVPLFRRLAGRWIATGIGCDADVEVDVDDGKQ